MLELRRVAALDVAEGRVGVHHALVAQVLERHGVARRARTLQPALAERQRPEVLIHQVQQLLRRLQPKTSSSFVKHRIATTVHNTVC